MTIAPDLPNVVNAANQPDLRGNLFPVTQELTKQPCEITGKIPAGLRGSFVRNGPNPMFEPASTYHMFDGDGMLHGVDFTDDGVSYTNRWIRSRGLQREMELQRSIYVGLAELSNWPSRELTGEAGPIKNPANTHVIRHADKLLALWEGGLPTEVAPDLETIGEYDYAGKLDGSMTAHPRIDPRTGEMFFFGYEVMDPSIRYYAVDAKGNLIHKTRIQLPNPIMMHDLVITEDYAVILDSPIVFNVETMGKGPLVTWRPEAGTRIGIMPRLGNGDEIKWFEIEPGHVQHFWNGWQTGQRVEFAGCRMPNPDFGIDPTIPPDQQAADAELGTPARFWVDLQSGEAGWEEIDDMHGDFCRFNDDMNGIETRWGYMSAYGGEIRSPGDFDTVVKYDTHTGEKTEWNSGATGHVGEAVFAPNPDGTGAEDDGWLLNYVYDDQTEATDVVILDARDIEAGPLATIRTPQRVPFGFHANWFKA